MLGQAIALGLVSALGRLDGRILGISMFDRPIVTSTLAGLILGDPVKGVMIGAALELIYIGAIAIGAASPPDIVTGSILATSFAIISGQTTEAALALSVPIAMFGLTLGIMIRIINAIFIHKAEDYAEQGNARMVAFMHIVPSTTLFFLESFLTVFLAIGVGSEVVTSLLNAIPKGIVDGLVVGSRLLPALGFALLINMMISKKLAVYFFLGFLLASYMKVDIIGVALFGVVIAILMNQITSSDNKSVNSAISGEDEEL